jgi:hypothetical protein
LVAARLARSSLTEEWLRQKSKDDQNIKEECRNLFCLLGFLVLLRPPAINIFTVAACAGALRKLIKQRRGVARNSLRQSQLGDATRIQCGLAETGAIESTNQHMKALVSLPADRAEQHILRRQNTAH